MKVEKEATEGCFLIVGAFIAITIGLPWASSILIGTNSVSAKVIAFIFILAMLIIAMFLIPNLMIFWIGMFVVAFFFIWISGEGSYICVPVTAGSCE